MCTLLTVAGSGCILHRLISIRMKCPPVSLVLCAAMLMPAFCTAQSWLYPESIHPITPLMDTTAVRGFAFFPALQFWGEAAWYAYDSDKDHRWDITIGGTSQLLRGVDWDVIHETSVHLAVNPGNNIGFNPRAFMWETGILVGVVSGRTVWQFGYQHRCKHDVDNVEILRTTGREEERALMYGSAVARWRHQPLSLLGGMLEPLAEAHFYIPRQDQRFPEWTRTLHPLMTSFIGALRTRQSLSLMIGGTVRVGMLADLRATLLGSSDGKRFSSLDRVRVEPAAECFADVAGTGGTLRAFIRYAYLPDDFIPPIPRSTHLVAAGIRLFQK